MLPVFYSAALSWTVGRESVHHLEFEICKYRYRIFTPTSWWQSRMAPGHWQVFTIFLSVLSIRLYLSHFPSQRYAGRVTRSLLCMLYWKISIYDAVRTSSRYNIKPVSSWLLFSIRGWAERVQKYTVHQVGISVRLTPWRRASSITKLASLSAIYSIPSWYYLGQ